MNNPLKRAKKVYDRLIANEKVQTISSVATGGVASTGTAEDRMNRMGTGALSGGTSLYGSQMDNETGRHIRNAEDLVGDMYNPGNQKSAIGEPVKEYLNPTPAKVDTSAYDASILKQQQEEEDRRRMRRLGSSLLDMKSTGTSSLGVSRA